jgi:hypothetical protein
VKIAVRALVAIALALTCGCARPDWVQQTLVTVDVTGVWVGGITRGGSYGPLEIRLELQQQGSRVTGYFRPLPPYPPYGLVDGPIEGTVAGDAFSFQQANGILVAEATVNGDEMLINMSGSHRIQAFLRRIDSAVPPRSQ